VVVSDETLVFAVFGAAALEEGMFLCGSLDAERKSGIAQWMF
jgi:hypothetical protein